MFLTPKTQKLKLDKFFPGELFLTKISPNGPQIPKLELHLDQENRSGTHVFALLRPQVVVPVGHCSALTLRDLEQWTNLFKSPENHTEVWMDCPV